MWSLLRYVAQGFGWELGREAARSALDEPAQARGEAEQAADGAARRSPRELARERRRREKAAKKRRKEAARAARREEKAVDAELEALRKRVRGR